MKNKLRGLMIALLAAMLLCLAVGCERAALPPSTDQHNPYASVSGERTDTVGHAPTLRIDTATGTVAGDYIYRMLLTSDTSEPILVKYQLTTGQATTVCQDPYCMHRDESCAFYLTRDTPLVAIGNTVCFSRKDASGVCSIVTYDGTDMTPDEIYRGDDEVVALYPYQYHFYYILLKDRQTVLYRYDTRSKESEQVMPITIGFFSHIENDWIYCKASADAYYIYDLDGNYLPRAKIDDYRGYLYENRDTHTTAAFRDFTVSVYRTPVREQSWEKIAQGVGPWQKIHDRILYFVPIPMEMQKKYSVGEIPQYDYWDGNVYSMKLDGSDARLLCHAEEVVITGLASTPENRLICGDWMGILVSKKQGSDNDRYAGADLLLVNLRTGAFRVSDFAG